MSPCEFLKLSYSSKKNLMKIKGRCNPKLSKGSLLLQERIKGNDLYIPRDIIIPCKIKNGLFVAEFNLSILFELTSNTDLWDCFLVSEQTKSRVMYSSKLKDSEKHTVSTDSLIIDFYKTTKSEFSISVKSNYKYQANLLSFKEQDGNYLLNGELPNINLSYFQNVHLTIRKRDNKNSILYKDETNIPLSIQSSNRWNAIIDKQSVYPTSVIQHEEVWDTYIKVESINDHNIIYIPLTVKAYVKDDYSIIKRNIFYEAKFYINKKNILALWTKRRTIHFNLIGIKQNDSQSVAITCKNNEEVEIIGTRMEIEIDKWSDLLGGFYLDGNVVNQGAELELTFPVQLLGDNYHIKKNDQFNLLVLLKDKKTLVHTWMPLFINNFKDYKSVTTRLSPNYSGLFKLGPEKSLIMLITAPLAREFDKPVNIAVLGTCYTRGAFNSNPYFNPDYKEKYNVTFTQFHSSLPSLMSQPVEFPSQYFADKKPMELEYLRCDFEKTFFKQLSDSKAEYFLFDLYPDAVRDLIVYDDKHIITGNFYLRNRKFLQSIKDKVTIISHDNEELFLKYWCPAAERFAEKILEYFPQDHIVLQRARMINRYYDEKGQVKFFSGEFDLVKRSNAFFKYMESYILKKLPNIHTIDLNLYGFIGQYNHPNIKSTNHYEPGYYKKLMGKFDEIVFYNSINK